MRFAMLLVVFLTIAGAIIWRRSYGFAAARSLHDLDARRAALAADRLRFEQARRAAGARDRLQAIAEQRLNLHVPVDSMVTILERGLRERP